MRFRIFIRIYMFEKKKRKINRSRELNHRLHPRNHRHRRSLLDIVVVVLIFGLVDYGEMMRRMLLVLRHHLDTVLLV